MLPQHDFTVGIEEEFFLVDATTFDCVETMPEAFRREAKAALGDQVKREIIASMIEINSSVHASVPAAISELSELREVARWNCAAPWPRHHRRRHAPVRRLARAAADSEGSLRRCRGLAADPWQSAAISAACMSMLAWRIVSPASI